MSETKTVCPYCKEPIELAAIKCKHCLEFLPSALKSDDKKKKVLSESIAVAIFDLIGKSLVPITVLIIALVFKPTLEYLLIKAQTAEFLGTKISFSQAVAYSGDLKPVELYYLLQSAQNFGYESPKNYMNYDSIKKKGQEAILESLVDKGLIEYSIIAQTKRDTNVFGAEEVVIIPTDKGKAFLIELGLSFDGDVFVNPP